MHGEVPPLLACIRPGWRVSALAGVMLRAGFAVGARVLAVMLRVCRLLGSADRVVLTVRDC